MSDQIVYSLRVTTGGGLEFGPHCSTHPRYMGVYKPRGDCSECWGFYNALREHEELRFGGDQ